jgi:hypothetical protein
MGNNIASMLVESLRNSNNNTSLISKTKTFPPEFTLPENIPGVAKAWVSFNGYTPINEQCEIFNSSNVQTVSCNGLGQYDIVFKQNTFSNDFYIITGSVYSNSRIPISAANTFYVKCSGNDITSYIPNKNSLRIQTLFIPTVSGTALTTGPAHAFRVNLLFYK